MMNEYYKSDEEKAPRKWLILAGRNFTSGIDHADWLYCPCIVTEGDRPRLTETGTPRVRAAWLRSDQATIKDTWSDRVNRKPITKD
jgi:hypothetical protein